jgi:hypothetical protein
MSPMDRVAQLYPQAPGSLFVAFYNSQTLKRIEIILYKSLSSLNSTVFEKLIVPHISKYSQPFTKSATGP